MIEVSRQTVNYIRENDWTKSSIVTIVFGFIFFIANNPSLFDLIVDIPWLEILRIISPIIAISSLIGTVILFQRQKRMNQFRGEILEKLLESHASNESEDIHPYGHKTSNNLEHTISDLRIDEKEILESEINRVSGLIWLTPDGEVLLSEETNNRPATERILLYLIGKLYAAEADLVDSKLTSVNEIASKLDVSKNTIFRAVNHSPYVEKTSEGRVSAYRIRPEVLPQALEDLT